MDTLSLSTLRQFLSLMVQNFSVRPMLFSIARDGYLNTFNFRPYPGEKLTVKIQGDNASTSLSINGKLMEKMDIQKRYFNAGKDSMNYVRTLVFPLEKAGAFKSRITNLKVYNEITK